VPALPEGFVVDVNNDEWNQIGYRLSLLACVASHWRLRFLSLRRRFMLDPPPHRRACPRPLVAKHCGMSNDVDDRASLYRKELAQCDRDDRAAENAETGALALIFVSAGIGVASLVAHETIGLTLGIIGLIAGLVWRSDLKAKSAARLAFCWCGLCRRKLRGRTHLARGGDVSFSHVDYPEGDW